MLDDPLGLPIHGVEDVEVGREIRAQPLVPLRDDLSGSLQECKQDFEDRRS